MIAQFIRKAKGALTDMATGVAAGIAATAALGAVLYPIYAFIVIPLAMGTSAQ